MVHLVSDPKVSILLYKGLYMNVCKIFLLMNSDNSLLDDYNAIS